MFIAKKEANVLQPIFGMICLDFYDHIEHILLITIHLTYPNYYLLLSKQLYWSVDYTRFYQRSVQNNKIIIITWICPGEIFVFWSYVFHRPANRCSTQKHKLVINLPTQKLWWNVLTSLWTISSKYRSSCWFGIKYLPETNKKYLPIALGSFEGLEIHIYVPTITCLTILTTIVYKLEITLL